MTPRVSVVVPTRDRLPLLKRALGSIDAQSFDDLEVIVVDDGSVDETAEWLRSRRPDVHLIASEASAGAAAARNRALAVAEGELVAFLDSDDAWHPSYLEEQVAHLDGRPELDMSHAAHIECEPGGRRTRPGNRSLIPGASQFVHLLAENYIHTLSVVVARSGAFERFGQFDESLAIAHDFDWYVRVLAGGGAIAHLPRPLVERSVPGGLIRDYRRWFSEERAVIANGLSALADRGRDEPLVRAYRSLLFARIALAGGDAGFGLARLVEAFLASPRWATKLSALSLARRARGEHRASPMSEPVTISSGTGHELGEVRAEVAP